MVAVVNVVIVECSVVVARAVIIVVLALDVAFTVEFLCCMLIVVISLACNAKVVSFAAVNVVVVVVS